MTLSLLRVQTLRGAKSFLSICLWRCAARSLEEVERQMIVQALQRYGGKRKPAAEELKISERTLYRKIKEYDLDI